MEAAGGNWLVQACYIERRQSRCAVPQRQVRTESEVVRYGHQRTCWRAKKIENSEGGETAETQDIQSGARLAAVDRDHWWASMMDLAGLLQPG